MTTNRTITELYQALRPLLLRDVASAVGGSSGTGGGMEAHALSGNWHTGTLAETQAPWAATKNEWATALATHAALPDVHHAQVHALVGGDHTATGLTVGHVVRATGATAFAWGQLQHGDLGGVSANQHHNQVHSIVGADHTISGSQFQVVGATGSNTLGLLTPAYEWGGAPTLLRSSAAGDLSLPTFTATTRVRTPLIDTASGNLSLQPASGIVALPSAVAIQTANYASQLTGWRATYAGEGDFRYLFTDELHAKSFIADLEQALAGGQIISKSVAVLATAFTAPAASGTATLRVRDLPSAANMAVFVSGDIVRLRQFSRAGGSLSIADCWGVVTSYADQADGTQTWTFTRSAAPNAGAMAAGTVVASDAIVLDYGTTGNGFYEVNAIDGAYGLNSPYARIVSWTTHPATGQALRVQMGNLRGVYGYASTIYGVGMGDPAGANVTVEATNGVRLRQGTTDMIVLDPAGNSYFAGVMTIGASGEIRQGTGTLGSNFTGLRLWRDSSIGRIGGYNANTLEWYAATDGRIYAGGGAVAINRYGYMVSNADFSSGDTWPFTYAGLHAVADVVAPTANYRGSLMFGQPLGVFTDVPRVWHFHYPGTLPASTPTGGGASWLYALTISDDTGSNNVWHSGNDGSDSGLDADTLDSYQASAFARLAAASVAFAGDVGAGTTTPLARMHAHEGAAANTAQTMLHLSTVDGYQSYGAKLQIVRGSSLAQKWKFIARKDSNGAEVDVMNITEIGVGIGTPSPAALLDVAGRVLATSVGYDWSELTPQNSWSNYGGTAATFGVKRFGNMVSVKGRIVAGAAIAGNTAINVQLATEYRPSAVRLFGCLCTVGGVVQSGRVIIDSSGYIRPQESFSTNDWVSVEFTYFTGG